ncbi:hypothetical protein [Arthrobacter sp. ZGTC412]|uniref:hypothetical protein n=1 Tax=Arthrobacter sp. ZGTC412 TaxID=2058900 RepID=UPI0015E4060B|nr:hypothetical protein [Arthrobacter sp. ZGTC412]
MLQPAKETYGVSISASLATARQAVAFDWILHRAGFRPYRQQAQFQHIFDLVDKALQR